MFKIHLFQLTMFIFNTNLHNQPWQAYTHALESWCLLFKSLPQYDTIYISFFFWINTNTWMLLRINIKWKWTPNKCYQQHWNCWTGWKKNRQTIHWFECNGVVILFFFLSPNSIVRISKQINFPLISLVLW